MIQGRAALLFGSVCSGIEAASVAWHGLGWRAAWLAEIDKFASAVLAHHYPSVPNLGDMTKIARAILLGDVPAPDVLCGGTPCQAFSVAGLRESLADARGNLTLKFVEIANAIDHVRTGRGEDECIVFWENVPGVLSTKDNAFGCFLAGLAGEYEPLVPPGKTPKPGQPWKWANAGAVYGPRRAIAWRTLDAQYFGVAQRRRRVFVVASARTGFDPAQVLFEWDGVRRDTAPRREARETAPTIPARSTAGGGLGTDFDCDGGVAQVSPTLRAGGNHTGGSRPPGTDVDTADSLIPMLSQCITTGTGKRYDPETETILPVTAPTLRGEGFDASKDGAGRRTPLVPVAYAPEVAGTLVARSSRGQGQINSPGHQADQQLVAIGADCFNGTLTGEVAATMGTRGSSETATGPTVLVPVAYATKLHNTSSNQAGKLYENYTASLDANSPPPAIVFDTTQVTSVANRSNPQPGDPSHPLAAGAHAPAIAFPANLSGTQCASTEELAPAMGAANPTAVAVRDISQTLTSNYGKQVDSSDTGLGPNVVFPTIQVRRLTPEECEALQGFPRGYTRIPNWNGWRDLDHGENSEDLRTEGLQVKQSKKTGKWRVNDPDGPRYKALGNSWAVPNVTWLGRRIQTALRNS